MLVSENKLQIPNIKPQVNLKWKPNNKSFLFGFGVTRSPQRAGELRPALINYAPPLRYSTVLELSFNKRIIGLVVR